MILCKLFLKATTPHDQKDNGALSPGIETSSFGLATSAADADA